MALNGLFGKNSENKDSLPAINPQSSILGAAGFAFKNQTKFNNPGVKPFSTEKILYNNTKLPIDEGSDSSEDEDDETTESYSSDDSVEQPKSYVQKKKNKLFNNVNDIQDDKATSIINKKPQAKVSATNIITDFNKFEFQSRLRALGGSAGNGNYAQSEIIFGNKISKPDTSNTAKSDFVSGPTANPPRIKVANMIPVEESNYNRSDIRSDVSWGSDPGQQQQQSPQVTNPTVKVNPKFIIESNQSFTPNFAKLSRVNNTPSHHTNTNEWNTKNTKSFDSRSEVMYRRKDKVVSSSPKTMSDVTYQPKELRTEVSHYSNPEYSSYGRNFYQHKPTVQASAHVPYSITSPRVINQEHKPRVIVEPQRKVASFAQLNKEDEERVAYNTVQNEGGKDEEMDEEPDEEVDEEIDELMDMTEDTNIQRKLLELHLSNKELLSLNKSLEERINEQSSEFENLSSDSLLKTQKEQLEQITNLENIIKDLTTKLSEQETRLKKIKDDSNKEEENKKVSLLYDPRTLPLHTLPRIIFDRASDDVTILYSVIKSLLYTFYIFPVLILFRITRKVYEKSKTKLVEMTTE